MRRRRLVAICGVLASAYAMAAVGARVPGGGSDRAAERAPDRAPGFSAALSARLNGLRPSEPGAYLALAEELEALGSSPHLVRPLAVHALGLGGARERAGDRSIAASAAVLLAGLATSDALRAECLALAAELDPRQAVVPTGRGGGAVGPDELEAARCLGAVLAGEAHRARDLLRSAGVRRVIDGIGVLADEAAPDSASDYLRRAVEGLPCRECRGTGTTKVGGAGHELCARCQGSTRPVLPERVAEALLVEQARLMGPLTRSWAAQRAVDGGAPVREVTAASVATAFGVDLSKPVWRGGVWAAE